MRLRSLGLVSALLLSPATAHAVNYVTDPLTSPTHPGRGSKGGTFDANGWTTNNQPTDGDQDAVWYEIPDALATGSVQVTVTGLSIGTTLAGSDHDLLVLYQAPSGQPEPVPYLPYFRNNDFKTFIRIFGSLEVDRPGATKLELAFCPRGDPWWHDEACSSECDQGGIAYANGSDQDIGWDAATPYTLRLEWGEGAMSFFRNGAKLGEVGFSGFWAPQPLRVRIGTPRNDGIDPGAVYMPAGLVFKDVVIDGTSGAMTPICGAPTVDAGTGGAPPVDGGGGTTEYDVLEDVTAASWQPAVFEDVTDLNVEGPASPSEPGAVVYLRFPPVAGTPAKALLRLRAHAYASAAGGSGIVCRVDDDAWQETTLTWDTRPAVSAICAGASKGVDPDAEIEWDVTPLVQGGTNVNLAIVSTDPDGTHLLSKEAGTGPGPKLVVTLAPTAGTGGSAGSGWGSGGTGPGGAGNSGGSSGSSTSTGDDSGCGCRAPAPGRSSALGAACLGLLLLWMRRRRL